jgi:two-component system response regulator VicR
MSGDATDARKVLLVVDDEPDIRTSISLILKMEGYGVLTASHAGAALELVEKEVPDLVLSDFMMPWMNGRDLILELRRRHATRHIPAILMSGVTPDPPEPWDAFLRKPMDIAQLFGVIETLLRDGRLRPDGES